MTNEWPQKRTVKGSPRVNFNNRSSLFDILRLAARSADGLYLQRAKSDRLLVRMLRTAMGLVLAALAVAYTFVTHAADRAPGAVRWDGEAFDTTCWTAAVGSDASSTGEIARLIRQLGDGDFKKREQASKMMLDFGTAAEAQLAQAAGDPDPERSMRATAALETLRVRARKRKDSKEKPHPVLALALPADIAERNMALGLLGETILAQHENLTEIRPCLPTAIDEARPAQIPFFLLMAERYWHPVPVWIGPRMVPIPADEEQPPLQPALDLVEYDLLAELDERWQPTTPKAKARVQAVAHYLSKGGQLHEFMFPPVPIPVWVEVLRHRFAQGDTAALAGLSWMDAAPPVEELLRLLKDAKDPARGLILGCLAKVDLKPHVSAMRSLLTGSYSSDAPILAALRASGVTIKPEKSDPAAQGKEATLKISNDQLLEQLKSHIFPRCASLLTETNKDFLRKTLADQTTPEQTQFHARCLLFLTGDKEQEQHLLKYVPPGTPFLHGGYSEGIEHIRATLDELAAHGSFPARAEMLLQQDLFNSDKIGPSVFWMLGWKATAAQKAEVLRKMDTTTAVHMAGYLEVWGCREAVPWIIKGLDAMEVTQETQTDFHGAVDALRGFADPRSGPCLVRVIENTKKNTSAQMAPEIRMKALEALLRIGAAFPEGKQTMLREIANERRFSVFRMVALAGLARISPEEGLAFMVKEVEAAPPVALPPLLDWLAATRLTGALPVLKKHLKHRYEPAALAAAVGMVRLGDGEALPIIQRLIRRHSGWPLYPQRSLLSYWKPDTPPDQVKMIRECLDTYSPACAEKPCVTRDDYCQEFGFYGEE